MHRVNLYNYRMSKVSKTEHNGAKNGGGYWGSRAIAKQHSKKNVAGASGGRLSGLHLSSFTGSN